MDSEPAVKSGAGCNYPMITPKVIIILFVIYLIIHTDLFIEKITAKINPDLVANGKLTDYGSVANGVFLCASLLGISYLDRASYI